MNTLRLTLGAALAVAVFLPSCKSKLEKCNAVCEKMEAEDKAATSNAGYNRRGSKDSQLR